MEYHNRQPEEGVNVTRHNQFLYFVKLMILALVCIVLLVVVMNFLGASLAKRIPFRYETALMDRVSYAFGDNEPKEMIAYLNDLSARLADHLPLTEEMNFTVSYDADNVFNAYATLGGNLVFYRGLLRQMPNENALAMVMAHEMSHVLHRDPVAGMSGGIASMLALMMLTGHSGGGTAGNILNQTGSLTQLTFSRDMETEADKTALKAVASYYGHVAGADTLFRILSGDVDVLYNDGEGADPTGTESTRKSEHPFETGKNKVTDWIAQIGSTHPLDQRRIDSIKQLAEDSGWSTTGELTELPADYQLWLSRSP